MALFSRLTATGCPTIPFVAHFIYLPMILTHIEQIS